MKSFKKVLIAIICILCLTLCACNGGEGEVTTEAPAPDVTTAPEVEQTEPETEPETEAPLTLSLSYDDYLTEIDGVLPTAEGVSVDGTVIEIIEVSGTSYFHAKEVGSATVNLGTKTAEVTVGKAKLNLIVVMGQSNSGNHFDNATSDIRCPLGTAYWWGGGKGIAARKPTDFTQATKGFHSPLLAELYAQSVAAGDPEKNVLVWHEGGNQEGNGTSKNGSSIYGWAKSATDASGTDYTVQMVKKCVEYYEGMSDKYEIVRRGVYWLQGEGDGVRGIEPSEYIGCFMAMWNKLKTEAGLEYMAIMRVRRGGDGNTQNADIYYSSTSASQYALANAYGDIFMATTLTENFTGAPTVNRTVDISNYITLMNEYSSEASHSDSYGNTATYKNGKLTMPMKTLFGSNNKNHYGKFGYALIAADAAYNMYRALHSEGYSITLANSSGRPEDQKISAKGDVVKLDITEMGDDLSFYATPGSQPGCISIKVMSGSNDVTAAEGLINTTGANYACVNIKALKGYDDVKITATYTVAGNASGSVTYEITDNSVDLPDNMPAEYSWEFESDLLARDKDGNVVNAFNAKALNGSYTIENGILKCSKLQLEIMKEIKLERTKNWSFEIGFGDITGANGFIIASERDNVKGNKALSFRGGKLNISDYDIKSYTDKAGYYNYSAEGSRLTSGCVMKLVNTYDPATGKSVMSMYKDGVLVIENMQNVTGDFNGSTTLDLTPYEVTADFVFRYLGCSNSSGSFLLINQIDFIRVNTAN